MQNASTSKLDKFVKRVLLSILYLQIICKYWSLLMNWNLLILVTLQAHVNHRVIRYNNNGAYIFTKITYCFCKILSFSKMIHNPTRSSLLLPLPFKPIILLLLFIIHYTQKCQS